MNIIKYKKKKNNKYEILLDDDSKIELYEEVILNNELLLKKSIENIKKIMDENLFYEAYYKALKIISSMLRSNYEIRQKLVKLGFDNNIVDKVIKKLETQGYLNDKVFANSYLNNQIITTYHGPYRIINDLNKKGIDRKIIDEVINLYDIDIQKEKVDKIVDRMIRSNRTKSNNYLKRKIYNDLMKEGYSKNIISEVLNNKTLNDDKEIREKEYEKIKSRLSKKYNGYELECKIKEALIRKGFYN